MFLINLLWRLLFFIAILAATLLLPLYIILWQQKFILDLAVKTSVAVMPAEEISRRAMEILRLVLAGVGSPEYLTSQELSHLIDVHRLMEIGFWLLIGSIILLLALYLFFRLLKGAPSFWQFLRFGAVFSFWVLLVFTVTAWISFPLVFGNFHEVFFPQGNFAFASDSNLIQLFTLDFFQQIFSWILVSALILLFALIMATRRYRGAK